MSTKNRANANAARWNYQSAAYTAKPGEKVLADANAGNVAVTTPSSPDDGDEFEVAAWRNSINTVSAHYNGVDTIAGSATDFTPFVLNTAYRFVYSATLVTWRVIRTGVVA